MSHPAILPFFKGRVALYAILEAAGIGNGDQVLLPGYTCIVVPNAILYRGAEPVYIDIAPDTYNLDVAQLEAGRGVQWDPERARAIIVQHTYGLPANMDTLTAFARRHNLLMIEDACHALGATWNGGRVGTLGDAAFFSTQWSKPVTTGLGGWAEAANPDIRRALARVAETYPTPGFVVESRLFAQYAMYRVLYRPRLFWPLQRMYRLLGRFGLVIGSSSSLELDCHQPANYCRRMGRLQVRTLERLLDGAAKSIATRRRNTAEIERQLHQVGLPVASVPRQADPVWLRYPLRVGNKGALLAKAREARIELGDWFLSPIHPNLESWQKAAYRSGLCPEAERASHEVINLPTHHGLDDAEIRRIVEFVAVNAKPPS